MTKFFVSSLSMSTFVPKCSPVTESAIAALNEFVNKSKSLLVVTGAGLSTESGIPDYRSEEVGLYARTNRRPVNFKNYLESEHARRRYWARNFVAWPQFSSFQPNIGHNILADWERKDKLLHLITQNIDRLHTKAGSTKVVELHGTTHKVVCLSCGFSQSRFDLQEEMSASNGDWIKTVNVTDALAPDGDVLLSDEVVATFEAPSCRRCGGLLKPAVVFFGENVPTKTVRIADALIKKCDSMLVIGSSLYVYSGYRLAVKCKEGGKRLAIVNIGPTRADGITDLKVEGKCGDILPRIRFL